MDRPGAWPAWDDTALLTDLYELTLRACWAEGMTDRAVFSLFVRRLPEGRNYLLACGLEQVLVKHLRFSGPALEFLRAARVPAGLRRLAGGAALPRRRVGGVGGPLFAEEPILEIAAPLPEAQLVEPFIMNQVHLQTLLAAKAARVVRAARGRTVVDFGLRRIHGTDAAIKAARAFYIAGVDTTRNVHAGCAYGVPLAGTMAHSYMQAHDDKLGALRAFSAVSPDTVLLIDTYDTAAGAGRAIELARERGAAFRVRAVRLDSGDLLAFSQEVRRLLDRAGLQRVGILASGSLDEWEGDRLLGGGAPIDGFGMGTRMGLSRAAPIRDIAYKRVECAGRGRLKLSPGKRIIPGRKQIFRQEEGGARRGMSSPLVTGCCRGGRCCSR